MKRIAALAALMITMLAVPAASAMASTGGQPPAPGYGQHRPVQVICLRPGHFRPGQFRQVRAVRAYAQARRHGKVRVQRLSCPYVPAKPLPGTCRPQVLRFDMAAGASTMTEVSGPVLAPTQEFGYDGNTYTIMSVNPGADSFTVFLDGSLFVNTGTAITDGVGLMTCAGLG